jgi:hypothetical protein
MLKVHAERDRAADQADAAPRRCAAGGWVPGEWAPGEWAGGPESRSGTVAGSDLSKEVRGNAKCLPRESPNFVFIPLFSAWFVADFLQSCSDIVALS